MLTTNSLIAEGFAARAEGCDNIAAEAAASLFKPNG